MDGGPGQQQRKLWQAQPMALGLLFRKVLRTQSHVSPRFSSSWTLCIQRVVETKRKGFFQLPAIFRSPVKTSSGPIFQLPLEGQRASFAWRHHAPCSWSSSLYTHSSSTFSFPDQDRCNNQKISECCDFCDIP